MKKRFGILVLGSLMMMPNLQAQDKANSEKRYFDINKNIETFNTVLKELDLFYVDSVDVNKIVKSGIVNMLGGLDPYTEYMDEESTSDFLLQTKGEYAGVGAIITGRNKDGRDQVVIIKSYAGVPAATSGLKVGDIILSIDGKDMTKAQPVKGESLAATLSSMASSSLKGQPETEIVVKVERPGVKKPLEFKVKRANIHLSSVPYYGIVKNNVGYISLTGFPDKCAHEVKVAFLDLKKQGATSIVLDLRNNGGGIMEEAIQIINLFVAKGQIVLSTKGKTKQMDRVYRTTLEPVDTQIPLAVLINRGSASASEIVSGTLQDLDRAAIIGQRSYGKGLVQVPRELPYGGSLKVTTSKYYIPSGRCVQAIDYAHRNEDGSIKRIPDSLTTVFKTAIGREVRDGGGVIPDLHLELEKVPTITYYLSNQFIVFDWATNWIIKNPKIAPVENYNLTDEAYNDFKDYAKSIKNFKYDLLSEKRLKILKEVMEFEGYNKTASAEFKALEDKLVPDLDRDLDAFKEDIKQLLAAEIVQRFYYQQGVVAQALKSDKEVDKTIELLSDDAKYKEIFTPGRKILDMAKKQDDMEEEDDFI